MLQYSKVWFINFPLTDPVQSLILHRHGFGQKTASGIEGNLHSVRLPLGSPKKWKKWKISLLLSGPDSVILLSVHAGHAPHNFSMPDREWACPDFNLTTVFTLDISCNDTNIHNTSHPRIGHGQWYPMACLEWSGEVVEWEQGMSCRTQGGISRHPEG